jgi:Xaa-Pro aminopeptidase
MFSPDVYIKRRQRLKEDLKSGLLLFLGNDKSPINYPDNSYPFRQDSSFLYFWGIDLPGIAAIIDIHEDREIVFGHDVTLEEKFWIGTQPSLIDKCLLSGVKENRSQDKLEEIIKRAIQKDHKIHFLPQYRAENKIKIQQLLGFNADVANQQSSIGFIKAVVAQRSFKIDEEVQQIEAAHDITYEMQTLAMKATKSGLKEKEVVSRMTSLVYSSDCAGLAYPINFTTQGQILHNIHHENLMKDGDLVINDSGAESSMNYATDITRTFPVSGKFTQKQKDIYSIVLNAQIKAIENVRAGIEYREIHLTAAKQLASGLKMLDLMKGDVDEAVAAGAHALFFPHGLGHMLGLDVHDMEDLGEDYVGYTDTNPRNRQFGLCYLRLARELEPGFIVTVEPGVYFIPELIDRWKTKRKFEEFINYKNVEDYRDFGGVRIEDDVLVLKENRRVLGKYIPKTIEEIEALSS